MASIRFNNVSRIYGDRKAVDNLNLDIADGEFLVAVRLRQVDESADARGPGTC